MRRFLIVLLLILILGDSMDKDSLGIIDKVIHNEGGYNNDALDMGGETKYGISKRFYPHINIEYLTLDKAKQIYYDDYWIPAKVNKLPYNLRYPFFDCVINTGQKRATKILQEAINSQSVILLKVDGIIGPKTLKAAKSVSPKRFTAYRVDFYSKLVAHKPEQKRFYYGWWLRTLETING
jgi:lysozyme family protein